MTSESEIQSLQSLNEYGWDCEIIDPKDPYRSELGIRKQCADGLFSLATITFWRVSHALFVQRISTSAMGYMNSVKRTPQVA